MDKLTVEDFAIGERVGHSMMSIRGEVVAKSETRVVVKFDRYPLMWECFPRELVKVEPVPIPDNHESRASNGPV